MDQLIPELLETDRLILQKPQEQHWVDLKEYYSDEECMRYTHGHALPEWQVWRQVATMVGHWELRGYGPFSMVLKESQKCIGITGPWFPIEWPEPEIKWGVVRSEWQKGFGKEGAAAALKIYQKISPENPPISLISIENKGSIALAESLGAEFEKQTPFRDFPAVNVYRHKY